MVRVMPFNDMVGALSQGTVDVAFLVQPFITIVEKASVSASLICGSFFRVT